MTAVFVIVVALRFLLPLLIPRYPLPAIIGCLVVDASDQSIFQAFGYDPPGYQSYDKAMDVFYLAIAYLATLRNWASNAAFRVSRFLYFYRLVGVVAFELTQTRALLLIFPNTFEYFFIAYEVVRSRWSTLRLRLRWLGGHRRAASGSSSSCRRSTGSTSPSSTSPTPWRTYAWAWPLLIGAAARGPGGVLWFVGRGRALPRAGLGAAPGRGRRCPRRWTRPPSGPPGTSSTAGCWSATTFEKVVLVGLLSVIFSQTLPGIECATSSSSSAPPPSSSSTPRWRWSRPGGPSSSSRLAVAFAVRLAINAGSCSWRGCCSGAGDLDVSAALFFVMLLSLLTTLHDRWLPVHAVRRRSAPTPS